MTKGRLRGFGFYLGVLAVIGFIGGCAGKESLGLADTLTVGQQESELVAQKGAPQEILPNPQGGKIYIYQRYYMDQIAALGGGVWGKTEQVYYYLDSQGRITKVNYYPYGKWKFLLPSEGAPGSSAQAAAQPPTGPEVPPVASPTPITPREPAPLTTAPSPPIALPEKQAQPLRVASTPPPKDYREVAPAPIAAKTGPDVEATTHLELNMTKEEVRHVLGVPERTEGMRAGGRSLVTWFYTTKDSQDRRVSLPVTFENGRLSGWGASYYLRLPKGVPGQ
jgi:hypothetical protein